jgi:hypothetical protein
VLPGCTGTDDDKLCFIVSYSEIVCNKIYVLITPGRVECSGSTGMSSKFTEPVTLSWAPEDRRDGNLMAIGEPLRSWLSVLIEIYRGSFLWLMILDISLLAS